MPLIPINEVGKFGIIADRQAHELPLNAWSGGGNVRFRNDFVEKSAGHSSVFGTPTVAPYFLLPCANSSTRFWVYAGLAKVYVWDGSVHTNLTRAAGGDYSATAARNWTGGVLGGIPFLNNGVDVPQFWSPVSLAQPLQNLTNWNANHRASAMRAYKKFMIGLNITKSGTAFPQMVKWSHPADAGALPTSWDETDATKDAGEYEIKDTNGAVVDGFPLRDVFCIYKEDSVHGMQLTGGVDIFRFFRMFDSFGILSRRCAVEYTSGKHAVFAIGDVVAHDGQSWDSIVDSRMRRWLFNQIDPTTFGTSFVVNNPRSFEVWFCFPSIGSALPNTALVWDWARNTLGIRDLAQIAHIVPGPVDTTVADTWDAAVGTWDSDSAWWGEASANLSSARLLMAQPSGPKLFFGDNTQQFDGSNFTSYIERLSLPLPVEEAGPPDLKAVKMVTDLWPRIEGTDGATINVYVGSQMTIDGPTTYKGPFSYVIGTTRHIPCRVTGRLHAFKFESTGNFDWRLHGYEVDVRKVGNF